MRNLRLTPVPLFPARGVFFLLPVGGGNYDAGSCLELPVEDGIDGTEGKVGDADGKGIGRRGWCGFGRWSGCRCGCAIGGGRSGLGGGRLGGFGRRALDHYDGEPIELQQLPEKIDPRGCTVFLDNRAFDFTKIFEGMIGIKRHLVRFI